ncbi:hypothetical protein F2Q69_00053701 [Brassica cretica]|uniref:Uncharacterized protein n=1 Tax=Brassica cretica TaxID=69181 RepID=A0A8S9MTL2_BRACR|nr:hypothetical protein F2Q69_00053701 [Brassica cretica]
MMMALAKREERSDDKSGRNWTRVATREEDRIGRVTTLEVSTSFSSPIFPHSQETTPTSTPRSPISVTIATSLRITSLLPHFSDLSAESRSPSLNRIDC